jgi:hypothetical protein
MYFQKKLRGLVISKSEFSSSLSQFRHSCIYQKRGCAPNDTPRIALKCHRLLILLYRAETKYVYFQEICMFKRQINLDLCFFHRKIPNNSQLFDPLFFSVYTRQKSAELYGKNLATVCVTNIFHTAGFPADVIQNTVNTLYRKSSLCIPRKEIARPQSQFLHSCVCE